MRHLIFKNRKVFVSIALLLSLFLPDFLVHAAFNSQINYQGRLLNSSGDVVADGTYHMRFKLYTVATGGTNIWSEDRSTAAGDRIAVDDGLFSVMLGSSTPLTTVDFNQTLYLGVEIGGSGGSPSWDGEMTPRKILGAVPAAFQADKIDGLSSEQFLRTDATNSTSTATTFFTLSQAGAGDIASFLGQSGAAVLSILSGGNIGIGTTSPYAKLSVAGNGVFNQDVRANYYTATSTTVASVFPYASTTALTVSGTNGLTLGSLNGPLQANNGAVSATTSVGVLYGGTGLTSAPSYGQLLLGNSSGGYTLTATSSLGIASGITAIGPLGQTQTGTTITFATSSTAFNGLTASTTITGSGNTLTFANTLAGLLGMAGGGTGLSSVTANQLLIGNAAGTAWTQAATSSLGLPTGTGVANRATFWTSAGAISYDDNFVWDNTNKRLGIGTTSPYAKLSVAGEVVASHFTGTTTATSTFAGDVWTRGVNLNDIIPSNPVSYGRKVAPIFELAKTERVAWIGIGDSNQIKDGYGWDAGVAKALQSRFGLWGSGFYGFLNDNSEAGTWGAAGYLTNIYSNGDVTNGSGAPAGLDAKMPPTNSTPKYSYLASSATSPVGFAYTGSNTNNPLRFHFTYGTHSSWSGSFRPIVRLTDSPFSQYIVGSVISTNGTDNALVDGSLDLPAGTLPANTAIDFRLNGNGENLTAPFFFTMGTIEDLSNNRGFSHQTLGFQGGVSTRTMLSDLTTFGTTALTEYFRQVRRLLGSNKAIVVNINEGLNDRNDTSASLGPVGGLNSSTPAGFYDNTLGIINLIRGVYSTNGWDQGDLYFLINPSHIISDPDDTKLVSYRNISAYLASQINATNTAVYWFDRQHSSNELDDLDYYDTEVDTNHLSDAGYDALAAKMVDSLSVGEYGVVALNTVSGQSASFGSSSPYAKLAVHGTHTDNYDAIFAVASSTLTSTTTLFSVHKSGAVVFGESTYTYFSGGNFGIGTTTPYAKLSVVGEVVASNFTATSTTATSSIASGGFTVNTNKFLVQQNSGFVGFGTSSPFSKISITSDGSGTGRTLTIANSSNVDKFIFTDNGKLGIGALPSATGYTIQQYGTTADGILTTISSNTASIFPSFKLRRSRGTVTSPTVVQDTNTIFDLIGAAYDGSSYQDSTKIRSYVEGPVSVGVVPSSMAFSVYDMTEGLLDSLIVSPYRVGVGTSTPTARLAISGVTTATSTNRAFVIDDAQGTNTEVFTVLDTGFLGLASTSPWRTLSVNGTVGFSSNLTTGTTGNYLCINTSTYQVTSGTTCAASSERFKENIEDLTYGLEEINQLRSVSFTYKKEVDPDDRTRIGFIAEEVNEIVPELVTLDSLGLPESVDYSKLTAVLVNAVKELSNQITSLSGRLTALEQSISSSTAGLSIDGLLNSLEQIGVKISDGLASFEDLVTETFTVGSSEKPAGINIFDEKTGEPYCIKVKNGDLRSTPGECEGNSLEEDQGEGSPPTDLPLESSDGEIKNNTKQESAGSDVDTVGSDESDEDEVANEDNDSEVSDGSDEENADQ